MPLPHSHHRRLDLACVVVVLCGIFGHGNATSTPLPTPLSISPSLYWDGDDGWWSTFHVQVGTPGQTVRLLPGTSASASSTTWVVISEGCTDVNPTLANCREERGGIFYSNQSSSWSTEKLENGADGAIFSLVTFEESYLGLDGNGSYGYDTISLGLPGSGLPTLENQVIAGIWTNNYYLGLLGLSPVPFNFTTLNEPQQSMLSTLRNKSLIPSLSWSYSAGAHYVDPPVFGSLTLGGYDTTRFRSNNVSFAFGADFSRDLLVSLQSITYDTVGSSPLLTSSIDIFIDSLTTESWLPLDVCEAFAQQFNLTWNTQGELYLVDETAHTSLLAQNPTFTFTISQPGTNGEQTVDIVLPYAAFDLNLTAPIVGDPTRYFPLKRAQNSTQYTLGRTFLQEAYVIADYDRRNFSISQALFPSISEPQNIVAIHPPNEDARHGKSLSAGAIAGTVVAAVLVAVAGITFALLWTRRRSRRDEITEQPGEEEREEFSPFEVDNDSTAVRELDGRHPLKPQLDAEFTEVRELDGRNALEPELEVRDGPWNRHELATRERLHEMGEGGRLVELPT